MLYVSIPIKTYICRRLFLIHSPRQAPRLTSTSKTSFTQVAFISVFPGATKSLKKSIFFFLFLSLKA